MGCAPSQGARALTPTLGAQLPDLPLPSSRPGRPVHLSGAMSCPWDKVVLLQGGHGIFGWDELSPCGTWCPGLLPPMPDDDFLVFQEAKGTWV